MKQIIPNRDLQNEIQKNKVLNSRDFYKGKSFRFVHEWHAGITYFNDEFVTDFVVYNNVMLACKKSHTSSGENAPVIIYDSNNEVQPFVVKSDYWEFVLSGISTQDGKFKVGFSDTVENLPNANEHIGEIYVVGPINDSYVEYVAIHSPSYDDQYIWEKVSSDVTIDAYTKQESDEKYQIKGNYLTSIPEEYITTKDLNDSIADWEAEDGNSFIKNKTHYKTHLGNTHTLLWSDFDYDSIIADNIPENTSHIYVYVFGLDCEQYILVQENNIISITSSGPSFDVLLSKNDDGTWKMVCKNSYKMNMQFYMKYYNVVQLDNIYLPNSVITTENVNQITLDGGETEFK